MMTPPDLNDAAQRAAYRRELRYVARPLRLAGLAFALLGVLLVVGRLLWWRAMPIAIPAAALALGAFNMVAGMAIRTLYHARRMRGE
ncbi:hypothetical protein ASG11_07340 [Sphingomonas sp. Leaf357]|uniref:hypothetical protein n=1 Tax=Sphingomonas sp. Leaf357 TaxID=1736350 RepID=UPI0006F54D19|nr:hypothetical protein [Sphingomonas sp. Leaf357]KQS05238.1 hypothetical protein ASG11_07340 [Sphingomonas sp. Leaf357]